MRSHPTKCSNLLNLIYMDDEKSNSKKKKKNQFKINNVKAPN